MISQRQQAKHIKQAVVTEGASYGKPPGRVTEALNGLCARAALVKELDQNEQQVRRDLAEMVVKIAPNLASTDECRHRPLA